MSNHLFTFILAGGSGERFWPLSRSKTPKHLLRLLSDQTLLETTVRQVENFVPWERVFVLHECGAGGSRSQRTSLSARRERRGRAGKARYRSGVRAVGFARRDKEAICALLADAVIHDTSTFQRQLAMAAEVAGRQDVDNLRHPAYLSVHRVRISSGEFAMAFTGWFALSKNQIPQPPDNSTKADSMHGMPVCSCGEQKSSCVKRNDWRRP